MVVARGWGERGMRQDGGLKGTKFQLNRMNAF